MRIEILTIDEIKPSSGEYKYIATVHIHPSWFKCRSIIKKQAVSTHGVIWYWTDTFRQTSINDPLERFLKKQDYENQIMNKLQS